MTVRKTIKRANAASANAAMDKHVQKMAAKGWVRVEQFAGDEFLQYAVTAYFEKRAPLWTAQATRRNVDGKPDYVWTHAWANGRPVLYVTESDAYAAASSACADTAHGLHTPRATLA